MRIIQPTIILAGIMLIAALSADAAVYQSLPGPHVATGGGGGTTLIDTTNDAGDWIDLYSAATDSGALYYAWDWTVNNNAGETGSGGFFGGLQLYENTSERLAVGNNFTSVNLSTYGYTETDLNPTTAASPGTTVRLAVQIDFLASANDQVKVWLNPEAGVGITQSPTLTTTLSGGSALFNNIRLRTGNGSAQTTFADISFGQNFSDVVGVDDRIVFADDFGETDGTVLDGKAADVGGPWSVPVGGTLGVNKTAVDTTGGAREAYAGFTDALGPGELLVMDFQTNEANGAMFTSGFAGIGLYAGGDEKIFIGDLDSDTQWGVQFLDAAIAETGPSSDESVLGKFIYNYDTGGYQLHLDNSLLFSGTGTAGLGLDELRIANNNGGDIAVSELAVSFVVPAPAALPAGLGLLGLLTMRRRKP